MTASSSSTASPPEQLFPTADVARTLGVSPAKIRIFARAGVCTPGRRGRRYQFRFQDLVLLRAAIGLTKAKVPLSRLRRALRAVAEQLSPQRPLSGVRVYADGKNVVVRAGNTAWQPESGQILFSFAIDDLARRARGVASARPSSERGAAANKATARAKALALFERALLLEGRGDNLAAEEAYRTALQGDPEMVDAYVNLGRLVHNRGATDEAARLYHLAVELAPHDPVVHYNLALTLEDKRRQSAAMTHYQRAIALDADFADAHFNLARLLERSGHRSQALKHLAIYKRLTQD